MWLYVRVCACCFVGFASGMSFPWTSPVFETIKTPAANPFGRPLTPTEASWIAALASAGAAIAPTLACLITDKIGRKRTLQLFSLPAMVAYAAMSVTSSVEVFYVARLLIGLACGSTYAVVPTYIGEISEPRNRGSLSFCLGVLVSLGSLYTFCVGPYLSVFVFSLSCMVPYAIFLVASVTIIPESPYFLVAQKRESEAENALILLRSKERKNVQKELLEIVESTKQAQENKTGFRGLLKSKPFVKGLMICVPLVLFQHLSGINVILAYLQTIIAASGDAIPPQLSSILVGVAQMVTCVLAACVADKIRKRTLLLVSLTGAGLGQTGLATYFLLQSHHYDLTSISWLPTASVISYIFFYFMGLSPVTWALLGELFPGNVKAVATAIVTTLGMSTGVAIMTASPLIDAAFGMAFSFVVFGMWCAVAFVFAVFVIPDTRGMSLREIQEMLVGGGKGKKETILS